MRKLKVIRKIDESQACTTHIMMELQFELELAREELRREMRYTYTHLCYYNLLIYNVLYIQGKLKV